MTAPRHLWSGDWRRESAAAAEALARQHEPAEEPTAPPRPAPPRPSPPRPPGPSAAARALAHARGLRPGGATLLALAMLLSAGVGFGAVLLVRSGGSSSSRGGRPAVASSRARTTAPAWLGVDTMDFAPGNGVLVVDVVPGSPADAAGLQPGDVITQIGDRPVQTASDLDSALAGLHAGQQIQIQYERGPFASTTRVTLRARPANGP